MTDYISREAVLALTHEIHIPEVGYRHRCIDPQDIRELPAADVRPVVLCKDCKCYRQSSFVDKHMECARSGFPVHSVDFCSRGEKREESWTQIVCKKCGGKRFIARGDIVVCDKCGAKMEES